MESRVDLATMVIIGCVVLLVGCILMVSWQSPDATNLMNPASSGNTVVGGTVPGSTVPAWIPPGSTTTGETLPGTTAAAGPESLDAA